MNNIDDMEKEIEGTNLETQNDKKENNSNMWNEKPRPEEKLKKSIGIIFIGVLILLIFYAFYRVSFPNLDEKNNAKTEETSENTSYNKNDKSTELEFDVISYKKYSQEKKNEQSKSIEIPEPINKPFDNMGISPQNYNPRSEQDELLAQLMQQEIKEEMLARRSNLTFSNTTTDNNSNLSQDRYTEPRTLSNGETRKPAYPDDPNYQAQKREFLDSADAKDNYNKYSEYEAFSPYEIKAGAIIPGILLTGLNSDLPGTVLATVREDVYDSVSGNHLLIPKGTKIKGTYDSAISYGQSRILVVWQRLIFSDGRSINLDKFTGVDLSGYAGLTGKVNNHTYELFKAVVLSSMLGAGSSIIATNKANEDWESAAGTGAGESVMDIGGKVADKSLGVQPTIEIKQGAKFNIIVESDLILRPYRGK